VSVDGEWKKAGRDSSTAQADSFAGAKEGEASACSARNDGDGRAVMSVDGAGVGITGQ